MYLTRVDGEVHRVVYSTRFLAGWVVQGIFEVVRKFAKSKLGRECWQQSSQQFDLSWCEQVSRQGADRQRVKTREGTRRWRIKIRRDC